MSQPEYFDILFLGSGRAASSLGSAVVECAAALCC
jgi:hypothetical protein